MLLRSFFSATIRFSLRYWASTGAGSPYYSAGQGRQYVFCQGLPSFWRKTVNVRTGSHRLQPLLNVALEEKSYGGQNHPRDGRGNQQEKAELDDALGVSVESIAYYAGGRYERVRLSVELAVVRTGAGFLMQVEQASDENDGGGEEYSRLKHPAYGDLELLIRYLHGSLPLELAHNAVDDHFQSERDNDYREDDAQDLYLGVNQDLRAGERTTQHPEHHRHGKTR